MKLTLTKRFQTIHESVQTETIYEGQGVEYYQHDLSGLGKPSLGVIKKDEKGFYIEWDDAPITRIDDSEHSKEILEFTGFEM